MATRKLLIVLPVILISCIIFASYVQAAWSNNPAINNAICTETAIQQNPMLVSDGNGGNFIAWTDLRNNSYSVYAQRINDEGDSLWTANGVAISPIFGSPSFLRNMVSDGTGGAIVFYSASNNYVDTIYAQRISDAGVAQWGSFGVAIFSTIGFSYPYAVSDGEGGIIVSWNSSYAMGSISDIYAQRVDSSGAVQWTTNGVPICSAANNQFSPSIVSDGRGGAIITWQDYRNGSTSDIYAQRINSSGAVQWTTNGIAISTAPGDQKLPNIVTDGRSGAIITWQDYRSGSKGYQSGSTSDIYAQRINSSGAVQWTTNGVAISTATGNQNDPNIVSDGSSGAIITWQDYRSGSTSDIYAQRINSGGTFITTTTECTATLDAKLSLNIPFLSYSDGVLVLSVDFVYDASTSNSTLIPFKLTNFYFITDSSFSCAASNLSSDLTIHIPDFLLPDRITHLWVDLEYSPTLSTDVNFFWVVSDYGVVSN